ncbi:MULTISPECIES: PadR family transcriptional regulator [unclassified Streptomyces]|uniref:PadR family transcriptional regulator n=1 Tax=unclassified Streptomyces TaxID=2593676 RepID=UPI002253066D|nr:MULTISPECIES: PadR family transcriptional regulator [unclassified Streptomyces]MCX4885402.1 PadR family transcriptional regulator [Streptomyces sp. NBC_00847]MCX5425266.1 PadR family transcriptional regulator [Streptomyces sp. NBC_00078]
MLELAILGFLAEGPLPGHELRRRITDLTGYSRPVSDGTLYPAISRLTKAGLIERHAAPEAGGGRYALNLTDAGREDMLRRLRKPAEHEITDFSRWFVILAFLSLLPERAEQHAVLRRRLDFLEAPASFFYDGDTPLRAEQVTDPYRRGMMLTARATSRAERAWLHEVLDGDAIPGADEHPRPQAHTRDRKD